MAKRPAVLVIMDGLGLRKETEGNAVALADTPVLDKLMKECPFVEGQASGLAVGLPEGQMGNSEVGHLNMGAGRIVYQELTRITKSIQDGDFFEIPEFKNSVANCKKHDSALHLMGLVSDGGVHSHNTHIYGLLELAKRNGLRKVYVHCFMDGRDTPPDGGLGYIRELEAKMAEIGVGEIATISGRYYAMDRDKNYDRNEKAYAAMTKGEGNAAASAAEIMEKSYAEGKTDEFIVPSVVVKNGQPVGLIRDHDSIIFYNFRPDRARQISRCFCDDEFEYFNRGKRLDVNFTCFTDYDATILNKDVAFKKEEITNTFGEYISKNGKTQLRIAETEKYAHVTFFFNGGMEEPYANEDRILVPSPKEVPTYDLKPQMSAPEVCDKLCEAIRSGKYDAVICNFANSDMVGHTGIIEAAVKAVETVDTCVGKVCEAVKDVDGVMFICADHGNSDVMIDEETGRPYTAHTTNPVPFILYNADPAFKLREGGVLADIAPTMLELMGLPQPKEMTAKSLIIK
ncbi:MAG: 2,3-bisphosphoglycerate-independent phosphoglycerate mutase [Eubacteriales bacterium]|nr:2,3-bisphosphoglycerate-independent phosphoglycerate mutase [Eubacteriales bacterium]